MFVLSALTPAKQGIVKQEATGRTVSVEGPSTSISTAGHVLLAAVFVALIVAYAAVVLADHFSRPDVEAFTQIPAADLGPIDVLLTASCTNAPFCGSLAITADYRGVVGCEGSLPQSLTNFSFPDTALDKPVTVKVPLCYRLPPAFSPATTQPLSIPGVTVDFSAVNPGSGNASQQATGVLSITSADGSLQRTLTMETWQIKTLVVAQSARRVDGVFADRKASALTIQYDGKRPNSRSTLIVELAGTVNVFETQRPGSLLNVVASIGGATYVIAAVLALFAPLLACCFPGPARKR